LVFRLYDGTGGQGLEAAGPPGASDSFERGTASEGRDSYVSPYAGIHGRFWENDEEDVVTVTVTTTGFHTGVKEFRDDGTTEEYSVQDHVTPAQGSSAP